MGTTKNTSYKVHVFHTDQAEVDSVNIEDGAMLHTEDALYMGHNGENVIVYPQGGGSTLGWCRYIDTQYTGVDDSTKVLLTDGVKVTLPNNGGTVSRSNNSLDFYNSSTSKLVGQNINDVYITTIEFKASAANANQTHLDLSFEDGGLIENLEMVIPFYKGNDTTQQEHKIIQYYINEDFKTNGATVKIKSHGGSAKIWDIQFFIQRTQNGSLS